jgi:hypothetical protein
LPHRSRDAGATVRAVAGQIEATVAQLKREAGAPARARSSQ